MKYFAQFRPPNKASYTNLGSFSSLGEAVIRATQEHDSSGQPVRVIDDNEVVQYRYPPPNKGGRRT